METFITKIYVNESRGGVRDLEIPLSETNRQHLIITGKNGSGKTSLLEEIKKFLAQIENGVYKSYFLYKKAVRNTKEFLKHTPNDMQAVDNLKYQQSVLSYFGGTELYFSDNEIETVNKFQEGKFILAYFGAKRTDKMIVPTNVEKVNLQSIYGLDEKANVDFIRYIVSLKADRSFARDEGDEQEAKKIDDWFELFENQLKTIFDDDNLNLNFTRGNEYNFNIKTDDNEFGLDKLSDGYSAILSVVSELLLRMKAHNAKAYDMEGIVLIDEIETHLHVELQKRILPFLTAFFPKIQFIVTTHSPFVLQSVSNATICDLETRIITADLSAYSSETILESYFMTDKYSDEVKRKVDEYEKLMLKENKTVEDNIKIKELKDYFNHVPKYRTEELLVKLQQIELNALK